MKTTCPHCCVDMEIDTETHASLAGQVHFTCPACQGVVPSPAHRGAQAPNYQATGPNDVAPTSETSHGAATHRNLLILGVTALLMLGGIGFVLASRYASNTNFKTRNIRNEIINNFYFKNLIATRVTTMKDLDAVADFHTYEDGFIGISAEPLEWPQANDLARRTGAIVLPHNASDAKLTAWLAETFPPQAADSLWITRGGVPALIAGGKVRFATHSEGANRVVLRWQKNQKPTASLPWVNPVVPLPDAEGWVTLFNGEKLHGCSAAEIVKAGDKIKIGDGALVLDATVLRFDVTAKNVKIRAVAKKVSGITMILGCRFFEKKEYAAWFNGRGTNHGNFGLGWSDPKFKDIKAARATRDYPDFFRMEISAVDNQLTLMAEDEVLASAQATTVDHFGTINVRAVGGISFFKNIKVKVLDEAAR